VKDDLPGPGVSRGTPGQELIPGPDPKSRQEKGGYRGRRRGRVNKQLFKVMVEGIAASPRLIQVDDGSHPGRWPALLAGSPEVEMVRHIVLSQV